MAVSSQLACSHTGESSSRGGNQHGSVQHNKYRSPIDYAQFSITARGTMYLSKRTRASAGSDRLPSTREAPAALT
jgi:hypothetical protein